MAFTTPRPTAVSRTWLTSRKTALSCAESAARFGAPRAAAASGASEAPTATKDASQANIVIAVCLPDQGTSHFCVA